MSVSTNAVVDENTRRLGSNTKDAKRTITVVVLNERREVEHRYDPTTQTTAAVVIIQSGNVKTPYVLYTTDNNGNTTIGGSGADNSTTQNVNVFSESDAARALASAEIEGETVSRDQVISEGNLRINALASTQEDVTAPPHVQEDPKVVEAEQQQQNNNILGNITEAGRKTIELAQQTYAAASDILKINPDGNIVRGDRLDLE